VRSCYDYRSKQRKTVIIKTISRRRLKSYRFLNNRQDAKSAKEAEQGPSRKREIPKSLFSSCRTLFRAFGLSRLNFLGALGVMAVQPVSV